MRRYIRLFLVLLTFIFISVSFSNISIASNDKLSITIFDDENNRLRDVTVDVNDKDAKAIKQKSNKIVINYVKDDGTVEKKDFHEDKEYSTLTIVLCIVFTIIVCAVLSVLLVVFLQYAYFWK